MYPNPTCWYPAHISSQVCRHGVRHGSMWLICLDIRPILSPALKLPLVVARETDICTQS